MGSKSEKVETIPPSNHLRAKLGLIGDMPVEMDMEALRRAEEAVAQLQESYPEWVGPDVDRMEILLNDAKGLSGEARTASLRELFDIAHNIKGQGVSFSYPLMTDIGQSLCAFLHGMKKMDDGAFSLIKAHIQAMQVVMRDRLQDAEDPLAKKVISELCAIGARIG